MLCENSVEDNIYYSPQYAVPLLQSVNAETDVVFITTWQGEVLTGLLPITRNKWWLRGVRQAGQSWLSPYTFNCMPLIDRSDPVGIAGAIIDCLIELGNLDWMLKDVYLDGPAIEAFRHALDDRDLAWQVARSYNRASMNCDFAYNDLLENHVPSKRRKDLRRNDRRLRELGTVTHEFHENGDGLEKAVGAFLDLEKRGWKGAKGTALACNEDSLQFAKSAFVTSEVARSRVDLLLLDGKPIAAGVIVFAGDTAFTVKGAYDEEYRNFSAGLLLELEVAKSFLGEKWAKRMDSATAGEHVIDFLWPERREVVDIIFTGSQLVSEDTLKNYSKTQKYYNSAKRLAKKILNR
jgi:CelD/BcsL family acetyltransferase involved in cellulose biosynthesis